MQKISSFLEFLSEIYCEVDAGEIFHSYCVSLECMNRDLTSNSHSLSIMAVATSVLLREQIIYKLLEEEPWPNNINY